MNFDEYFGNHNELALRVLVELPESGAASGDRHVALIGGGCIAAAAAMYVWALQALADPGYFARASTFLAYMLLAGTLILIASKFAESWLMQVRIRTRELVRERTVSRLITADRVVAQRLAERID